jgi:hypothetical protein
VTFCSSSLQFAFTLLPFLSIIFSILRNILCSCERCVALLLDFGFCPDYPNSYRQNPLVRTHRTYNIPHVKDLRTDRACNPCRKIEKCSEVKQNLGYETINTIRTGEFDIVKRILYPAYQINFVLITELIFFVAIFILSFPRLLRLLISPLTYSLSSVAVAFGIPIRVTIDDSPSQDECCILKQHTRANTQRGENLGSKIS